MADLAQDQGNLPLDEQAHDESHQRNWPGLPDLLLFGIARRLTVFAYLAFAGTCRTWRSFAKSSARQILASHPPLLSLFQPDLRRIGFYSLADGSSTFYPTTTVCNGRSIRSIGYSHGYLILLSGEDTQCPFQELGPREVDVHLFHPFTRNEISCFPKSFYDIFCATLSAPPSSPDCMLFAVSLSRQILLYCRPGDLEWKGIVNMNHSFVMDLLVITRGTVYCISQWGGAVIAFSHLLERNGLPMAETLPPSPIRGHPEGYALLSSAEGDLYLLSRLTLTREYGEDGDRDFTTRAFRYDESRKEWLAVESFAGPSAFITWYGSVLVDVDGPKEWKDGICCFPELGWYHLNTKGREDIACRSSWEEGFGKEGIGIQWLWRSSACWVLPSLCYYQ